MLGKELKSALVTGGSEALDRKCCRLTVSMSSRCRRSAKNLKALKAELGISVECMDISDAAAVSAAFGDREVDILINCAGVLGPFSKLL